MYDILVRLAQKTIEKSLAVGEDSSGSTSPTVRLTKFAQK